MFKISNSFHFFLFFKKGKSKFIRTWWFYYLQNRRYCALTMTSSSPSSYSGFFTNKLWRFGWQTNGQNVLFEHNISIQFYKRNIILKISWWIVWMHFFTFNAIFFVVESFLLISYIPFTQTYFHVSIWSCSYTVSCRNYPTLRDKCTTTAEFSC